MNLPSAIVTRDLVKKYGRRRALDGFTLSVPHGSILGLVGPNGAGKTTWMMVVAGFIRANAGEIDVLGKGTFDARIHAGRLAILPQDSELPLESRPRDLLFRFGRLQGLGAAAARKSASDVLEAVNLSDRADATIRSLSHGMRKRVMLAQCFVGNPEVVLLDEPLNGLDPAECAHEAFHRRLSRTTDHRRLVAQPPRHRSHLHPCGLRRRRTRDVRLHAGFDYAGVRTRRLHACRASRRHGHT